MASLDELLARGESAPAAIDDPELAFLKKPTGKASLDDLLARGEGKAPTSPAASASPGRTYPNAHLDTLKADLEAAIPDKPGASIVHEIVRPLRPVADRIEEGAKALLHQGASAARVGSQLTGIPTVDQIAEGARRFVGGTAEDRAGITKNVIGGLPGMLPGVAATRTLTDEHKRRELERGIDDAVTLGYGQRAVDKVTGGRFSATAADDAAAAPDFRPTGNLIGQALPGASKLIGKAAGNVAGGLFKPATTALGAAVKGAAQAAAGYELAAPVTAALAADSEGHRIDAARNAATDPIGLATSVALGGGSAGAARAIQNSRGAQARRFIEEAGGGAKVSVTSPGKGGVFERELAGVPANDRGIGIAAQRGGKALIAQIERQHQIETSGPYQKLKKAIDNSPEAIKPRDVTSLATTMQDAVDDLGTHPAVRSKLEADLKILEKRRDPVSGTITINDNELNSLRRNLMDQAGVGATEHPGGREAPLRAAAFEAKRLADEGPYRLMNAFYSAGAKETAARRTLVTGEPKAREKVKTDNNQARLMLQRGEPQSNSYTAGAEADRLNQLRAENPNLIPATNLPSLAQARADLAFRLLPQHGGVFGRLGQAGLPGAGALGLGAMALHAGPLALAPAAAIAALQNRNAINGRILAPLAQAAPQAGDVGQRLARAIQAARNGQQPPFE